VLPAGVVGREEMCVVDQVEHEGGADESSDLGHGPVPEQATAPVSAVQRCDGHLDVRHETTTHHPAANNETDA